MTTLANLIHLTLIIILALIFSYGQSAISHPINNYKTVSSPSMTSTAKQLSKPVLVTSIISYSGLAQRLTTCQNLASIDITNPAK